MAERNEVSRHEVALWGAMDSQWRTSGELAELAAVAPRTARAHALRFVKLGIAEVAEVFPGHRYRAAEKAEKANAHYVQRLRLAAAVFGLQPN